MMAWPEHTRISLRSRPYSGWVKPGCRCWPGDTA